MLRDLKIPSFENYYLASNFLNKIKAINHAILKYNQTNFIQGITRQKVRYYNNKLESKTVKNTQLIKPDNLVAQKIKKVELQLSSILLADFGESEKIVKIASLIVEVKNQN